MWAGVIRRADFKGTAVRHAWLTTQGGAKRARIIRFCISDAGRGTQRVLLLDEANLPCLTHWGRVTHICVGNLTIIGSDNGLSPGRRQAITWTNVGILLIGPLGTNFSEMLIEIHSFSFKKIYLKMSSGKWWPFCLGLNVLMGLLGRFLADRPQVQDARTTSHKEFYEVTIGFGDYTDLLWWMWFKQLVLPIDH